MNIKSYIITTLQNKGKTRLILELLFEYRDYCKFQIRKQLRIFKETGRFNEFIDTKNDKSILSERYKRNAVKQVVGQLRSWQSNKDNRIAEIISSYDMSNERKRKLRYLKNCHQYKPTTYYTYDKETGKIKDTIVITKEDVTLFKSIKRQLDWKIPDHKNIPMQLNTNVFSLEKKKKKGKKKATGFDAWIKLTSLIKGKKIPIPANYNKYLLKQIDEGKLLNALRIDYKDGKLTFNLCVDKPEKNEVAEAKHEKIALDFGLNILFASSNGQLFGLNFGKKLRELDERITKLQIALQQQKIKPTSSKRFRNLVRKAQEFIKNEINMNINHILEMLNPKEIVVEKLNFSSSKLSRRMNRLLRKCGRAAIRKKLAAIKKDFGVIVTEANPAYSSQHCPICGFVHKKNRNTRDQFICKFCGYKKHADVVGSRNISLRSSGFFPKIHSAKRTVKDYLFDLFLQNIFQSESPLLRRLRPDRRAMVLASINSRKIPTSFDEVLSLIESGSKTDF